MGRELTEALPDSNPSNHPVYTLGYDAAGNQVTSQDPLGYITTSTYDSLNRLIATTDPLNHATTLAYDADSNKVSQTDPLNRVTTYAFDAANRQIAQTDALGNITTLTLDAAGRQTVSNDPLSLLTTFSYTSRNQLSVKTDPLSNAFTYAYSATGATTGVTYHAGPGGGGGGGGHYMIVTKGGGSPGSGPGPNDSGSNLNWTYGYDALNREVTATDPLGNVVTTGYDAAGNKITVTDRLGHVTTTIYDADNRVIATEDPLGHYVTLAYDAAGNKISQTDSLGRITTFSYDAQNRLIAQTDPRGGITSYGYDLDGRQTSIEDSVGNFTTYSFDAAGRQTQTQDALGTATVAYDAAGQVTGTTDRDGRRKAFTYDNAGRKLTEQWLNGQGQATRIMTYTYNADGWLKTEQDPSSYYAYLYDADGHLCISDNAGTPNAPHLVLTYSFDGFGNRTGWQDNYGGLLTLGYNADNDLTSENLTVSGTQGPQVTLAYDAQERLTGETRFVTSGGSKITEALNYDNADRLTTIAYSSSQVGALATFSYGYDNASQLTSYTGPEGSLTYTYDNASELTAVGGARSESFQYDLNGNRSSSGYTTAAGNELTGDGTFTYAYDSEGNQISKTRVSDGENWSFTWDYHNRMTQAVEKTSAGVTVTNDVFTYDVEDRRIGKSTNGTQVWYGYSDVVAPTGSGEAQSNSYIDFNGSGSVTMRYLQRLGLDTMLARYDGTNVGWYLTDNVGSVRLIVNPSGTVLDQINYYAFGGIQNETNSSNGDRFKFTGREWDSEIALYNLRARPYGAFDGRFVAEDPSKFSAGDNNLYRYVANDPTDAMDRTGLQEQPNDSDLIARPGRPRPSATYANLGMPILPPYDFIDTTVKPIIGSALYAFGQGLRVVLGMAGVPVPAYPIPTLPPRADMPPGPGWTWGGKPPVGGKQGNWYNPDTGESLRPDLNHPPGIPPHWDWKDPGGSWWRIFLDGSVRPK
jgi:RHS repeat-associated protein